MTGISNAAIHLLSFLFLIIGCSDKIEYLDNNPLPNSIEASVNDSILNFRNNNAYTNTEVKLGCDILESSDFDILQNKRVGLVTNGTGVNSQLISTIDLLYNSDKVNLVALFGPEHGIRGDYEGGDLVESYIDSKTGLPVYSLYGKNRKPSSKMLKNIDVIVYDIQDIGIRSYTYISTMGNLIEEASKNNIEFVVLDRPNPLGGNKIEGNIVEDELISFIGQYPIPYIYGLTCGELAKLLVGEKYISTKTDFKLIIVEMENWSRDMVWEDTGLQWIPTSPHIPHQYSPYFCAMTGILGELRSAISVGIGYTLPFQIVGAKWIDSQLFAEELNKFNIPGLQFSPITYKPYYAFGAGESLNGVQIFIKDYTAVNLLNLQFYIISTLKYLYPQQDLFEMASKSEVKMFNKGIGTEYIYKLYQENFNIDSVNAYLDKDITNFRTKAEKYYLYE